LENVKTNKTIFKTIKNSKKPNIKISTRSSILEREMTSNIDMKKMMKLMKNRLSARKCRQKKKSYVKNLEKEIAEIREELNKYKSIQTNEMKLEYYIDKVFILVKLVK
jgi:bZIP transcription factor